MVNEGKHKEMIYLLVYKLVFIFLFLLGYIVKAKKSEEYASEYISLLLFIFLSFRVNTSRKPACQQLGLIQCNKSLNC